MKQWFIIVLFLLQASILFAQQGKRYIKKGNELYQQQKYKEAEANYRQSVGNKNQQIEGNFNLGDALYKQKKFPEAAEKFNQIAAAAKGNKAVAAQAYHNLGNSYVENKKLEEGIEAYKKALTNNPDDDATRYNLAYAQEMLKKQQQQNKDNKDKNKDKQNKDNKNQDKNKDKDKDKKDQDKQNQDQNKKDPKDGEKPQPDKLSKDDAERMLDALNNNEKQTQDKLKNKKFKGVKGRISKDW